jgi:hypothetical protein
MVGNSVSLDAGNFTGSSQKYLDRAEVLRDELSVFWAGKRLRNWSRPCRLTVQVTPGRDGGYTSFKFDRGEVYGWTMSVHGSESAILDSILPHEINHAVLASITRRPIPRWLDEGAATLFEQPRVHREQRKMARHYRGNSWCCWNRLDHTGDYPPGESILALYSTGFSTVEWLLERGGSETLLAFIRDTDPMSKRMVTHYSMTVADARAEWGAWVDRRPVECAKCRCSRWGGHHAAKPSTAQISSRPRLTAVGVPYCIPCVVFGNDVTFDAAFRAAITGRVDMCRVDGVEARVWAQAHGVRVWPSFVLEFPDGRYETLSGYPGKLALVREIDAAIARHRPRDIIASNTDAAPPPPIETVETDETDPVGFETTGPPAAETTGPPAETTGPPAAETTGPPAETTGPPAETTGPPAETTGPAAEDPHKPGWPWVPFALGAASLAGVGLPAWAVYALGAARAARRMVPGTSTEDHYVVDAPTPPIRRRTDTRFVDVESDNYQRAHEHARAEIARRYPGSQEILEAELSLTEQFLAGQPPH